MYVHPAVGCVGALAAAVVVNTIPYVLSRETTDTKRELQQYSSGLHSYTAVVEFSRKWAAFVRTSALGR